MSHTLATDIWNTGQTFTETGPRADRLHEGLQFRNAHRIETTDLHGRPWTVWWTRATWDAKVGRFSVLSVLCVAGTAGSAAGRLAA